MGDAVINSYILELEDKRDNVRVLFNSILSDGRTFQDCFVEYLSALNETLGDDYAPDIDQEGNVRPGKKLARFENELPTIYIGEEAVFVYGKVACGIWGDRSQIVDPDATDIFEKLPTHLEARPHCYVLVIPNESYEAFIFLEKKGPHGIVGPFLDHGLKPFIQDSYKDGRFLNYLLNKEPFFDDITYNRVVSEGFLSKLVLIEQSTQNFLLDAANPRTQEYNLVQNKVLQLAKRGDARNLYRFRDFDNCFHLAETETGRRVNVTDLGPSVDGQYDELRMTFTYNGRNQTYTFGEPNSNLLPNAVIENVDYVDSYPTLDSFFQATRGYYNELRT